MKFLWCQPARDAYKQVSIDDMFNPNYHISDMVINRSGNGNTVTRIYSTDNMTMRQIRQLNNVAMNLLGKLSAWKGKWGYLSECERASLYDHFVIPKAKGGVRPIDAPKDELSTALYELKELFETLGDDVALNHTNAFAYIKNRSVRQAAEKHAYNKSNWFLKTDFSGFFPSTTLDWMCEMILYVYPFCTLKLIGREQALKSALELCMLNGGLPQGTPISPLLTNIMMIPIDHTLTARLRKMKDTYIYTRYADDIFISSYIKFDKDEIIGVLKGVLDTYNAPFVLKPEKTRFVSGNNNNWILGCLITKDHEISIGRRKKEDFKKLLHSYANSKKTPEDRWSSEDLQYLLGLINWYLTVEPVGITKILDTKVQKYPWLKGSFIDNIINDIKGGK